MLDFIRIIQFFAVGKFDGKKDLKKGFYPFIFLFCLTWVLTCYNASMSFGYYLERAGTIPGASIIAAILTGTIAIAIVFLGTYNVDFVQDWFARGVGDRTVAMFAASCIMWIALQVWDINVNLEGVKPISEFTTQNIIPDNSLSVKDSYQRDIREKKIELLGLYHNYFWCAKHKKRHEVHAASLTGNSFLSNFSQKKKPCPYEKFWFGCGGNGLACSTHEGIKEKIAALETTLFAFDSLQINAVKTATTLYDNDVSRYGADIKQKTSAHTYMVLLSYALILFALVYNCNYTNQALDYVYAELSVASAGIDANQHTIITEPDMFNPGIIFPPEPEIQKPLPDSYDEPIPTSNPTFSIEDEFDLGLVPDNTGKKYKKKKKKNKTIKVPLKKNRITAEEAIVAIENLKLSQPDITKAEAVRQLDGIMGRTTVFKYWDAKI